MEKLLLIDGNSMLFRAYYATVYGQSMSTSEGIPTNAIYGFALMLSKALKTIEPDYILVAFDHGKDTYRHKEYPEYKGTRSATPDDLKTQFPIIREYIDALHIKRHEQEGLEADDIIGCLAKQNEQYDVNILTSDKDLLQLVDDNIKVWLMHKGISDIVMMTPQAVYDRFQLEPKQIIDMKALAGDPSDNIPGVRKIGDKTAIKLLNQYQTVENLYDHIDEQKGKLKENLILDKDNAYLSKRLATIITDADTGINISDCKYQKEGIDVYNFYVRYQMRSLANRVDLSINEEEKQEEIVEEKKFQESSFVNVNDVDKDRLASETVLYIDEDVVALSNESSNYEMSFSDFLKSENIKEFLSSEKTKIVYDLKAWQHLAIKYDFEIKGKIYDLMIMAFLCDSKIKTVDDLCVKYHLPVSEQQLDLFSLEKSNATKYASRLLFLKDKIENELNEKKMSDLYWKVELPLVEVLTSMEETGVVCDEKILDKISVETKDKMDFYQRHIYQLADKEFNINSPKQLAEVIYDDLKLAKSTKRSTDIKVLQKLSDKHPIIDEIIQYRKYAKLYSTYAEGLKKYIQKDGKIHTVFNQCITETGRLSSSDPNLQNISVRNEEAALVREAFIPEENCVLVGADYSQVELRMLAHLADEKPLIEAFKNGLDAHTKTAMDIFGVSKEEVTPLMRRQAKAINFGIDYGMTNYGLSERLNISVQQASDFIKSYFEKYPNIKKFMDESIRECELKGYVTTILNRRREIPEIRSSNRNLKEFGKRAAMNAPVQGSAADLIKVAMINVYNRLKKQNMKSKLILQIHDELILNVPLEEKEEAMKIVTEEMENAMKLSVPLVAQATCGNTWLEVK